jgi:signal-transduction protein with cAMP-binding, CBS, and nucleotidyltransferase domain
MALLVSAKSSDVKSWRAAGDFAATYRQLLLARLEFCRSDEAEGLLLGTEQALSGLAAINDLFGRRCDEMITQIASSAEPSRRKELTGQFFAELYDHIGAFGSATAFYKLSTQFLQSLAGAVIRTARMTLDLPDEQLPAVKLIALGPAGRQEFSPFCPLHLLLVHEECGEAGHEILSRFGVLIHEGFESCGFLVDGAVSTHNHEWRGSVQEWRQHLTQQLEQERVNELIDFFRLIDQQVLYHDEGFNPDFNELCRSLLKDHRSALAFQVTRVLNLSHGIGMMGGMRFEKKGPFRGRFALLDNAHQPLSAAISVLALIKKLEPSSSPQRIREILWRREMNVDMAERLLLAWHALHEMRLTRESDMQADWSDKSPLYLKVEEMSDSEQNLLRESLDAVGAIQRHIGLTFSGMGE